MNGRETDDNDNNNKESMQEKNKQKYNWFGWKWLKSKFIFIQLYKRQNQMYSMIKHQNIIVLIFAYVVHADSQT